MPIQQQLSATRPTDWFACMLESPQKQSIRQQLWVCGLHGTPWAPVQTLLSTSEVSWTNAKSSSVTSKWKKRNGRSSRFRSVVCWEKMWVDRTFSKGMLPVSTGNLDFLQFHVGIRFPRPTGRELLKIRSAEDSIIYFNNRKISWPHVSLNCQQIYVFSLSSYCVFMCFSMRLNS